MTSQSTTRQSTSRVDIYQAITDQIITAIEAGAGPVQMPWHRSGAGITRPMNVDSGKAYRGINTVALWAAAINGGFCHGLWGTYRQWQDRGAQVRKGETSSPIIFFKAFEAEDQTSEDGKGRRFEGRRCMAQASRVFNVGQVDGYTAPTIDQATDAIDPIARVDRFIRGTGARIREGGDQAYYSPLTDTITMPDRFRFVGTKTSTATESWYSTLLHELVHQSGHESRLKRRFGARFGDDAYAIEEMVADLGSCFLCADLGIASDPRPDHAAYIAQWFRIMKGDRKAIFAAASAASTACQYLAGLQDKEQAAI
ncbi:ArdC family protein [Chelatococcus asaccharovorans]|uniref:ArdC family protein n=1 Tax=Chelatococcus asaccharovorans TaxID=28210 RepID=UPI00224C74E5|nr:zincin-like metallopeptidase domain-containing protein [Chelatococcus asaccharovorans]CAH1658568.1 Peptidase M, neutral zinc metallopeptidase, zinc-binding site [Chelatococcus asaccharovorans]CAH1688545.1 Peptidase M, neutral zinc metallopeptidase, zinc-binding site [Chelatococcus asaccharovorans]